MLVSDVAFLLLLRFSRIQRKAVESLLDVFFGFISEYTQIFYDLNNTVSIPPEIYDSYSMYSIYIFGNGKFNISIEFSLYSKSNGCSDIKLKVGCYAILFF